MKYIVLCLAILCLAPSLMALPDREMIVFYYDSNGDQIGWKWLLCNGNLASGGSTSSIYSESYAPCFSNVEPIVCDDIDMEEIGSCPDFCVTSGYLQSYNNDYVPDCGGLCLWGEGPGAGGSMHCDSCWKGTFSCPAKDRPARRKSRPTLRAALELKAWSALAYFHKGSS